MMNKKYKREYKESQPVLAICYDFDRTLSPDDMQAQGYIQSVVPSRFMRKIICRLRLNEVSRQ